MTPDDHDVNPDSGSWRGFEKWLWLFAAVSLLLFLGRNDLWGSEDRWAEIVRNMLLSSDLFHPAINHVVYFDKPLLTYWLILPFALLSGGVNEAAVRLPSALAALAALWGTMRLARELYDRRTALLSGWLLAGSYGFVFWGRTAAAEMANVAAIVLAAAWFMHCRERVGFRSYLLFYLIAFCGAWAKGLTALVMPLAAVLPFLLRDGLWRRHLKFSNLAAFLTAAAIYFVPFLLASALPMPETYRLPDHHLSGLGLVWRENVVRAFRPFDHRAPVFCYLYELPRVLLPWSLFFAVMLAAFVKDWRKLRPETRGLAAGALLMFMCFTISGSRRWYYILPLAPFCLVLTARSLLEEGRDRWNRCAAAVMRVTVILISSVAVISIMMFFFWDRLFQFRPPLPFLVALPLLGILVLALFYQDEQRRGFCSRWSGLPDRLAVVVIGGGVLVGGFFSCILPPWSEFRFTKEFAHELRNCSGRVPVRDWLVWGGEVNATLLFYLERKEPMAFTDREEGLRSFLRERRGRRILLIARSPEKRLRPMIDAFGKCGIAVPLERPDLRESAWKLESRGRKKYLVWILDIPAGLNI